MKSFPSAAKLLEPGFTLVELMIVVSVIGILAGLSVASFSRNWRDERVKAAARESAAWLDEVRRVAIQRGMPCRVTINQATAVFSLVNDTGLCPATSFRSLNLKTTVQNTNDLALCSANLSGADPATFNLPCTSTQSGTTELAFTPRGTSSTGLLLKLHLPQSGTDRCVAVMAPLGQIRSGKATSTGCDFTTSY